MEAKAEQNRPQTGKQSGGFKYVASFVVMMLLTGLSFAAVAMNIVPQSWIIPLILALATVQVLMQFFSFMHLHLKKEAVIVSFMYSGVFLGLICAVAVAYLS
ncbi:cytochrome C oxidase subunit IV family protein [Kroppenstedtia eburnea]|uniref:cytochrome C oxidase subunit IV family protein n=1 Tax=Kroppenstedtia eburnea TaxID=714067 RepID=UPI00363AF097